MGGDIMNHANGLATEVYDTFTESGVVALADHTADYGSPVYSQIDNTPDGTTGTSDMEFTANGLESNAGGDGAGGVKIELSKPWKKISINIDDTTASALIAWHISLFVPKGTSRDFEDYANLLEFKLAGGISKLIDVQAINNPSPAGNLVGNPAAVTTTWAHTAGGAAFVIERVGSKLKAYNTVDGPDTCVEYDASLDSRFDQSLNDIIIAQRDSQGAATTTVWTGFNVEF